jgi:hypothetical protein
VNIPTWALAIVMVVSIAAGIWHEFNASGPDYCALANLRRCQVADRGEFIVLSGGEHTYMLLKQGNKILSIQQFQ